ncbi:MAG: UDP-N-acetylmuramate dehydrogenase [Treponema sp.]|nr:UDP-N-acetylmuramate dehydrogenase [Treponema sp.]
MFDFLTSMLKVAKITYTENEPLAPKSTFKVGGNARLYICPQTIEQLESSISALRSSELPYFVTGGASNVVYPDGTYEGAIINTQAIKEIFYDSDDTLPDGSVLVTCQCGVSMAAFVDFCTRKNLTGAEQFAGLPGTIGGAVYMNARCFERSISDLIYSTKHLEYQNNTPKIVEMDYEASEWDYKKSPFQASDPPRYLLEVTFSLKPVRPEEHDRIAADCKKYINERISKGHFKYPSAGSVFKNNHAFGAPSGKLIDECGLKGLQIGGAQIAPFHGNFIINIDHATADDIYKLVQSAKKAVKEKFGFSLEPEIIFV